MGFLKKKFREKKKFPNWIYIFPAFFIRIYYRFFFRHEIIDPHDMVHESRGVVAVTWHNRLFFYAVAFPKLTRERSVAVVSASRDGQYVSDFISQLGLGSIRGSSSRGGAQAQLAGVKAIQEGKNVCFTPDGPRGPKYKMKPGPVHLASLTGAKILPLSINFSYFHISSSYCRQRNSNRNFQKCSHRKCQGVFRTYFSCFGTVRINLTFSYTYASHSRLCTVACQKHSDGTSCSESA